MENSYKSSLIIIVSLMLAAILAFACSDRSLGPDDNPDPQPQPGGEFHWISYGEPGASSISAMAANGNAIIAGTANHGIFLLPEGDSTWQEINSGLPDLSITAIGVDVAGNLFAGAANGGLFRRRPGNNSWSKLPLPEPGVWTIAFTSNNTILAGGLTGSYRSTDNGDSWTAINQGIEDTILVAIAVDQNDVVYGGAGTGGGVFRSTNFGDTWQPTQLTTLTILSLEIDHQNTIYAGTLANGLLYSSDQGGNWQLAGGGFSPNASVNTIQSDRNNKVFAGGEGDGVYVSEDRGNTWALINDGLATTASHRQVRAMALTTSKYLFVGTASGTVYRTRYTTDVSN